MKKGFWEKYILLIFLPIISWPRDALQILTVSWMRYALSVGYKKLFDKIKMLTCRRKWHMRLMVVLRIKFQTSVYTYSVFDDYLTIKMIWVKVHINFKPLVVSYIVPWSLGFDTGVNFYKTSLVSKYIFRNKSWSTKNKQKFKHRNWRFLSVKNIGYCVRSLLYQLRLIFRYL